MKEYKLSENNHVVIWNENLQPRKTEIGHFKDRVKFNIEFDINEMSKIQQKIKDIDNMEATNKDLLRIAILTRFGLNNERITEAKADTTEATKDVKYYIKDVNSLVMKALKKSESVDNDRITAYINASVPKELRQEVLTATLNKEKEVIF